MKKWLLMLLLYFCAYGVGQACSTAIISGKATADGRPLLWKHRDAREQENDLRFFQGEKFNFIGLCNTEDTTGTQVWMGSNSSGFSIMNANAYNLSKGEYKGQMDQDGFLMKEALEKCSTVADFEALLQQSKGKWGVRASFGVIDAKGGAAFFEVSPDAYEKFDVNDEKVAPLGYLIRTNYGMSGKEGWGDGYVRDQTLAQLFEEKMTRDKLSAEFLLLEATRSLRNSVLKTDLYTMELPADATQTQLVYVRDCVLRFGTASSMVIQGVKDGENPRLTTIWTIPGSPFSAVTVPTWVGAGEKLPQVVTASDEEPAPLSKWSLELKENCFPLEGRDGKGYLNLALVLNKKGEGILQKVLPEERKIISRTNGVLKKWRAEGFKREDALGHYGWVDGEVRKFYKESFGME